MKDRVLVLERVERGDVEQRAIAYLGGPILLKRPMELIIWLRTISLLIWYRSFIVYLRQELDI